MSQSKRRLLELNARLAQNLNDKGVEATADETTTVLVRKVVDIPTAKEEQEKTVDITENGTTEILPDEGKALSKVTVNANVADSYYDRIWKNIHLGGEREDFRSMFINRVVFTAETFYPKPYIMRPTQAHYMFRDNDTIDIDLEARLKECESGLDMSNCYGANIMFGNTSFTVIPELNVTRIQPSGTTNVFSGCKKLVTIRKLIVIRNNSFQGWFGQCESLQHLIIEGEIGATFDIKWSPLTAESAKSIITHLVNYTGTENEFVYSVLFADSVWELLNAEGATAPGDITWEEYVASIGWKK